MRSELAKNDARSWITTPTSSAAMVGPLGAHLNLHPGETLGQEVWEMADRVQVGGACILNDKEFTET